MKVAIYHPWIYLKSGLERTIMELTKRSRHDWTIFTSHYDREGTYPEFADMGVVELNRISIKRSYLPVIKAGLSIATTRIDLSPYQALFICCDGLGSFLAYRNSSKPLINLCFTPLRAAYDEEYRKRHLRKHSGRKHLALLIESLYRVADRSAWRRYSHVFCISETIRRRVLEGGLCPPEKIDIAYPGIDPGKIAFSETREPYFFLPGRIMWTKNIELGIRAFLELKKNRRGGHGSEASPSERFRLVVAGAVDEKSRPYFSTLKELAGEDRDISFISNPSDVEMERLYKDCYAVLFTAFNEDYGLTPLEGMSKGKPVIAVNRGGPTEVVQHGKTGLLEDPEPRAFSRAMDRLVSDPGEAARMGLGGLERSREFTWEGFVDKIDRYLDSLESGTNGA